MLKLLKEINIISLIKLFLLVSIFCLPKSPVVINQDGQFLKSISQNNTYYYLIPTNGHFEKKVLKNLPLIECPVANSPTYLFSNITTLDIFIPTYNLISSKYFIYSSLPRGPPLHS